MAQSRARKRRGRTVKAAFGLPAGVRYIDHVSRHLRRLLCIPQWCRRSSELGSKPCSLPPTRLRSRPADRGVEAQFSVEVGLQVRNMADTIYPDFKTRIA